MAKKVGINHMNEFVFAQLQDLSELDVNEDSIEKINAKIQIAEATAKLGKVVVDAAKEKVRYINIISNPERRVVTDDFFSLEDGSEKETKRIG